MLQNVRKFNVSWRMCKNRLRVFVYEYLILNLRMAQSKPKHVVILNEIEFVF